MNGDTVKAIRIHFGLSQRELAKQLGFTSPYVSLIESNQKRVSDTFRIRLAQVFGVTDELIEAIRRAKLSNRLLG